MAKERAEFDFNNAGVRKTVCKLIEGLRGVHWMDWGRKKGQRSLDQNAYYWGVVLPHAAKGISECWGEDINSEEAHFFFKREFLSKPLVHRTTGELKGYTEGSTASLDTAEFGKYLDKIIKFSAEQLGVEIPIALRAGEDA